ncbi:MAG: beta-aspartyl-peptidase [Bacteroidota bacterium]
MLLIKNALVFAPEALGQQDILVGGGKILAMDEQIEPHRAFQNVWDAEGKIMTPGLIDQHIHIAGAGGTAGFSSRTPDITVEELVRCGTTTAVGLLATDGVTRTVQALYAKAKALDMEGLTGYMLTSHFDIHPQTLTGSIQGDMMFIDKVLGCKVAISDVRSAYPTERELLRHLKDVRVGGQLGNKKGILHLHLGNLTTQLDILFKMVKDYEFPIETISPTHVGRTESLFEQSLEFAKMGGIIDITTGASQYTPPWKSVMYALEQGVPLDRLTFSSDGNTALAKRDETGKRIGSYRAPFDRNLEQVIALIQQGNMSVSDAFSLITIHPADNMGIPNKGRIQAGFDADFCLFDEDFQLLDVFANGQLMMENQQMIVKGTFS